MTGVTPEADKERGWVEDHQYDVEIPRPPGPATLQLVPFAPVQLGLLTAAPAVS